MKQVTHVKLYGGGVVDLTQPPQPGYHYVLDNGILYIDTDSQRSQAEYIPRKYAGIVIAQGVNAKEVDIKMPSTFMLYHRWCRQEGFKASHADTLHQYLKHEMPY